ncbi:hypothetical protein Nepgr_019355 [Nepenthes gracilis]|uniref:Elongation of fatty acids protein 3-like n=1 Tax=Nepenthes gracilis TaxID=150966 RepID=A0AAD3SV81_NEPGR|nr:hypothetical protein Nepgr_019355 [Nepenthes gracilis]
MDAPLQSLKYWLSERPEVVNFRWSPTQTWFSTWSFLITAIAFYNLLSLFLHLSLSILLPGGRRIPLGPLPAIHSLLVCVASATIFAGTLLSAAIEIRDTRWLWRRAHLTTSFQWLLCFPLGTRPSGRVFFWSYAFYLSRFLHLLRTFFKILRRRRLTFFHLFNQSILLCMSFLWLEFSQSFQVLGILMTTLEYSVVYGYRFWKSVGLPRACFPLVVNCQAAVLACTVACHVGVLTLHFRKGGCNGIGAWTFNSVFNGVILLMFLQFYLQKKRNGGFDDDDSSTSTRYGRRSYPLEATDGLNGVKIKGS